MPTLSPLAIGRPAWTSTAEQRLWSLLHSGHPAPVDTLVAELADTLHITVEQARKEVEHHLDLTGLINQGPAGASTPLVRTVGQTPKASLLAWGSPPESPKTPKAVFAPNNQEVPDRPPREPRRRARTEGYMKVSFSPGENGESPQELRVEVTHSDRITVAVIAPGAGTGINGAIYSELGRNPSFKVEVVGRSRAQYDVYPPCWPHGAAPPNLQTFAEEVLETRVHERVRCMVFGSRGGQVVLPQMWQAQAQGVAQAVPPVVVINGGCAMKLPTPKIWPDKQVLFALIGGKDNFRGHLSIEDYIMETRSHVPAANKTTAILFVKEMTHMPQQHLFRGLLGLMLKSIAAWKDDSKIPLEIFRKILSFLRKDGWSGILLYTTAPSTWEEITFSPHDIDKMQVQGNQVPHEELPAPMEFTAKDEVKALWKAAVVAATAPKSHKAEAVSFHVPKLATAALRACEGLQVPTRADMGHGTPDLTPISRTLGLQARPRGFSSGYSTPQSNHSSVSPKRVFFMESPKHLGIPGVV